MKPRLCLCVCLWLAAAAKPGCAENTATNPAPKDTYWLECHARFVKTAQGGGVELLFLGDSITEGWLRQGSNVWSRYYASRRAACFGIAGDRTQHLLWRIQNGELSGIHPKVVVLLIGTNNTGKERNSEAIRNTTDEALAGILAVVAEIRARLPASRLLVLGLFPRGEPDDPQRQQIAHINQRLAAVADGEMVRFLDLSQRFLDAAGCIPKSLMPDLLHPSEAGYEIWAEAVEPTLKWMLAEN